MPVLTEAVKYADGWVFSDSKQLIHLRIDDSKGPSIKRLELPSEFQDDQILAVACTSDGRWMATCHSSKKVILFMIKGLKLEHVVESCTVRRASALLFVGDRLLIVADRFGTVYTVDFPGLLTVREKSKTFTFPSPVLGRCTTITSLSCSPSGSLLGLGDRDGLVVIADTFCPERIRTILASHKQYITRVFCLSDEHVVTAGDSGLLLHYILEQGRTRFLLAPSVCGSIVSFSHSPAPDTSSSLGVLYVLCSREMNVFLYKVDLDNSESTVELLIVHSRSPTDTDNYFAIPLTPGYFLDSEGSLLAPTKVWPGACPLWSGTDPTAFYPAPPAMAREVKV
ncbi:hypothetical protein GMRT_23231 [Giardia muris]|uniref:Uncharacterized protein n=1 Tax=Giardia muris TaxID=5742 RepID=A0A4Z1T3K6_GIAMU|nr:hypothetical protein GMRT_23231 [Giardia muris]|eukprot:TNJ27637.1 hypothetical protein GMRT_23231 [Giardia muris]